MQVAVKISPDEILKQVGRICVSVELNTKLQLCRLLRYIVNETLQGREDKLKGFTIGLEVYKKVQNFDPEKDPIVRIHAGRLRRMLKLYYLGAGKNDPVKIDIPKGGYIPTCSINVPSSENQTIPVAEQKTFPIEASIAILPFKNLSGNPGEDYFAVGLAEELSVELTRFEDLTIYGSIPFANASISDAWKIEFIKSKGIRFIIDGGIHRVGNKMKILVKLIDSFKGVQIWANRYTKELTPGNINVIQENISREISCILGSEYGVILQSLSLTSKHVKPKDIETFDAILKFHYYEANQSPEAFGQAFAALQQALKKECDSGLATAMLASLHGTQYLLDSSGAKSSYEQMSILSEKAFQLNPNSLTVKLIRAIKFFINNEKDHFFNEIEKCLSMNPNSPLRLGAMGLYLSLYGDWERGKKILDRVMQMNVSYPLFLLGATTLFYYRKKEYDEALVEANKYEMPALFWGPMLRSATLGQLNKRSEAETHIAHLKQLKPDFEEEASYLISRFVKEDELVEHLIDGLRKAGMEL